MAYAVSQRTREIGVRMALDGADPRAFASALMSLALAALVASVIAARRAASVDPIVALRAE